MNHSLEMLKSHAYDCVVNRDMWQAELTATVQMIKDYKEPEVKKEEVEKTEKDGK